MELPKRKQNRLKNYDYNQNGAYFITICSKNKSKLFGEVAGACENRISCIDESLRLRGTTSAQSQFAVRLTPSGEVIESIINKLPERYPNVTIENYVIMPNHIHMIFVVETDDRAIAPTTRCCK